VAASVIAAGGDYSDTVTLGVGRNAGIKPYETVLNGSGYVGYVTTVSSDTSTVLLADDASSTIGVQMVGSGQIGAVTGTGKSMSGSAMLQLSLFAASAVLQPGQQVDTYASVGDQPEVPGVPVGTVVSVHDNAGSLTQTALVRPFVNFTALGVVGIVVQVPRHNPPNPILPHPAPTVTVTVTAQPGSSAGATTGGLPSAGASPSPSATSSASATG
jgi:rod shape-determining protein MreC